MLDRVPLAADHYFLGGERDIVDVPVSHILSVSFLILKLFYWHIRLTFSIDRYAQLGVTYR